MIVQGKLTCPSCRVLNSEQNKTTEAAIGQQTTEVCYIDYHFQYNKSPQYNISPILQLSSHFTRKLLILRQKLREPKL